MDRDAIYAYVASLYSQQVDGQTDNDLFGLVHVIIAIGQRHDPSLTDLAEDRSQSIESRG